MHITMALLLNICKFDGCAQIFQNLTDLIHHIEETHIIAFVPLPERSQPACLPLSCILPYNPPCETVAPTACATAAVNGATDSGHRNKNGTATIWASAGLGVTMTSAGGNATSNQPSEVGTGNAATATTNAVNGVPGAAANGISEQNGLGGASSTPSDSSKTSSLNQPTGTADLKRKIAIKHHSYSISSSNRSATPTGSELDDDDMMVSESEDSNDSWTTEEFSSEFIMRYGSRRHSSSGAGNGSNSSNEKPFACPVPGCKKRYKNVNGIKYHSKNGHKKDGNRVRKGFKCFCGKSYKTNQRLKIHNMLSHGPGWANATAAGSVVAAPASSSTTAVPSGSAAAPASAPESDGAVPGFETISMTSPVSLAAPAAPSQPATSRAANSNQNSSVNLTSTWDSSSFTIDFPSVGSAGTGASEQDGHAADQATPAGQAERSCSSTSNSNGSNSSVASSNSTSASGTSSNNGCVASGTGGASATSTTGGMGGTARSIGLATGSYNSNLTTVYPNITRFSPFTSGTCTIASSQNGTNASNATNTSPPPPPPPTLASAGQTSFTIAAQTTPKRTLPSSGAPSTTTAATLVISSMPPSSHGINAGGCFVTSTAITSPVSIKYDSLGILTPATSPKLIAASIVPEGGQQQQQQQPQPQQQLVAAGVCGGSTGSGTAVSAPVAPAQPPGTMPATLNANSGTPGPAAPPSAAAAAAVGEPVGIALVVSSISGCGELGSTNSTTVTTTAATTTTTTITTNTNNAAGLSASSATSQLYAEET